jgi:hypothetical protein
MIAMSKNDGGSAFPQVKTTKEFVTDPNVHSVGGMSLRDYFAAKSINGMLSALEAAGLNYSNPLMMAEHAYAMADAMLLERAK